MGCCLRRRLFPSMRKLSLQLSGTMKARAEKKSFARRLLRFFLLSSRRCSLQQLAKLRFSREKAKPQAPRGSTMPAPAVKNRFSGAPEILLRDYPFIKPFTRFSNCGFSIKPSVLLYKEPSFFKKTQVGTSVTLYFLISPVGLLSCVWTLIFSYTS